MNPVTTAAMYLSDDPGPMTEFEEMVGTKHIVAKYQKLIYEEEPPTSESSDEPFQFNKPDEQIQKMAGRKSPLQKPKKIKAHRERKMTDTEKIRVHRKRFGGCGVFRKESELAVKTKYSNMGLTIEKMDSEKPSKEESVEETQEAAPLRRMVGLKPEKKGVRRQRKNTQIIFGSRKSVSQTSDDLSDDSPIKSPKKFG